MIDHVLSPFHLQAALLDFTFKGIAWYCPFPACMRLPLQVSPIFLQAVPFPSKKAPKNGWSSFLWGLRDTFLPYHTHTHSHVQLVHSLILMPGGLLSPPPHTHTHNWHSHTHNHNSPTHAYTHSSQLTCICSKNLIHTTHIGEYSHICTNWQAHIFFSLQPSSTPSM